jgi:DNA repair exonuclease SbcCD ATPase subunit
VDLADVAHELYGLLPGDFTAERNQRAKDLKADGDAELAAQVTALGKPTSAAWLVNQLVRHHGEEVEQVAAVGAALREAQDDLDSGELLTLNKQRHLVLRAVVQQARALARQLGQPVSTAVADEVEQTLRAVMSDPDAAQAVRTGTLRRSLSGTGLGPVDLTDAVALAEGKPAAKPGRRPAPSAGPGRGGTGPRGTGRAAADAGAPTSGTRRTPSSRDELAERRRQHEREQAQHEREQAERERQEAERERQLRTLDEARRHAEEAEEQAASADEALERAQQSVDELADQQQRLTEELHSLEQQVKEAKSRLEAVQREAQAAVHARDEARHESDVTRRAADRARTRLERLT